MRTALFIFYLFSSFVTFGQSAEDSVVYVFAFERLKAVDTTERDIYIYTPIYIVSVDEELKYAKDAANSLEDQLRKYIIAEMGNVLFANKPCQCISYFTTIKEARASRLQAIESKRNQGFTIMDTPFSFSFKWQ